MADPGGSAPHSKGGLALALHHACLLHFCVDQVAANPENPIPETRISTPPSSRDLLTKTLNSKPGTRNLETETRDPRTDGRNPKPENRNPKPEIRNPKRKPRNPRWRYLTLAFYNSSLTTLPYTQNPKPDILNLEPQPRCPKP